jgi:hypothetical protein
MLTILQEFHNGVGGGRSSLDINVRKNLDIGYRWLTLNIDFHEFCQTYITTKGVHVHQVISLDFD